MDLPAGARLAQEIAGAAVMLNMQDGNAALARALEQRRDARQDAVAVVGLLRVHEHAALQIDHQQSCRHFWCLSGMEWPRLRAAAGTLPAMSRKASVIR
jgi:hypothetical protein